jgi:hypothetical protein
VFLAGTDAKKPCFDGWRGDFRSGMSQNRAWGQTSTGDRHNGGLTLTPKAKNLRRFIQPHPSYPPHPPKKPKKNPTIPQRLNPTLLPTENLAQAHTALSPGAASIRAFRNPSPVSRARSPSPRVDSRFKTGSCAILSMSARRRYGQRLNGIPYR